MPSLCGRPGKAIGHRFEMKLLFDQNLSFRLCQNLADLFPESSHVRLLGLSEAGDLALWDYAKANGFAVLLRPSPKVIWLRTGNQSTAEISILLRRHADLITAFGKDDDATCLEIY
jgi:predicted nuclease of predicted toxin-antitoxin system